MYEALGGDAGTTSFQGARQRRNDNELPRFTAEALQEQVAKERSRCVGQLKAKARAII